MTAYWLYSCLGVHVGADTGAVTSELLRFADDHIDGGRGAIQPEHIAAILKEHAAAQDLYNLVTGSI